tara:strand:- start:437 stop:715 length:279 start_codon:yes stop_codon:yes gene_type:complete
MGYYKNLAIEQEEDQKEIMTFYIEKVAKEIITGLELDKPNTTDSYSVSAYLIIQRVLQRNLDELFRVVLEEKDANENLHRKKEEIQEPESKG